MDRRNFFRKTAFAGVGAVAIPEILQAAMPDRQSIQRTMISSFKKNAVLLFQGDSITDAGRKREDENSSNSQSMLGSGYAMLTASTLLANNPEESLLIYNRGISGNKVFQLQERWEKDCLSLKPHLVSILIGVNDYWHTRTGGYEGTLSTYNADYRNLISLTKKQLPESRIIICEPFIIAGGTALDNTWEAAFSGYRDVALQISRDFELTFVPFQKVFSEALKKAPASYWGADGVHPSMAGAQLMAQAWMKAVL